MSPRVFDVGWPAYYHSSWLSSWSLRPHQYLVVVPGPRPTVNVDLRDVPQSEYAFMRSGERIGVIGTVASDRRRLLGRSIIRDAGQEAP